MDQGAEVLLCLTGVCAGKEVKVEISFLESIKQSIGFYCVKSDNCSRWQTTFVLLLEINVLSWSADAHQHIKMQDNEPVLNESVACSIGSHMMFSNSSSQLSFLYKYASWQLSATAIPIKLIMEVLLLYAKGIVAILLNKVTR